MKATFDNISEKKKQRVIKACIEEFGAYGYDSSSMDGIIKRAGISKGGLYEYVSSKRELFLFTVEYSYTALYDYLKTRVKEQVDSFPTDLLDRLRIVAEIAVDFYLDHPEFVTLIARTASIAREDIAADVQNIFRDHYLDIFGDADVKDLRFPKEKVMELSMWLLLKTRLDFLNEIKTERDPGIIKKDYMENWDFFLGTMRNGIYKI